MTKLRIRSVVIPNRGSVTNWCRKKYMKSFFIKNSYLVLNSYLLEFMVSDHFMGIRRKSEQHIEMIYEFMKI